MKIQITLVIDLGGDFIDQDKQEQRNWLFNEILQPAGLAVVSTEIGDVIGDVLEVKDVKEI